MLARVSRSDYFEYLFDHFADELAQASMDHELDRSLDLRRDIYQNDNGILLLKAELLFVPHCLTSYLARHGRKPHDHG